MKSKKCNISNNNTGEGKENFENNININNDIKNENFTNIKIIKEFESSPLIELKEDTGKNNTKIIFNESIEVNYEEIIYQLNISLKSDNNIHIELIPKEGQIPFSYFNILDAKKFYDLNKIFTEIGTIEKIYHKIIKLLGKNRVSLLKEKKEDIFYLILRITIIDEDKKIYIPLNKNENIQISTINYLLRETQLLKNDLAENEVKQEIIKNIKELHSLKQTNGDYIDIINKINKEEKSFDKICRLIMDKNEECLEMKKRINIIENEFNYSKNKIKCKFTQKNIIFYHDINQQNPYYLFHFGIKNTGNLILNSKYYNIFIKIEELSQDMLSFLNSSENYIHFTNDEQNLLPNKKTNICKKLTIKNLKPNAKYEFHMNIYSSCHGKISEQPLKINILTTEYKEKDFLSLLKNEDLNFDISNKKVIFEYLEEINIIGENNNKDKIMNKKKFKINTYLYNNKKGIIENKEEDWDNIDNYVVINKDYIENKKSKAPFNFIIG